MHTQQAPLGSGFGPATTAAEIIDGHNLAGKTAIVTGGYSGIGLETVRLLAAAGADVIVPARNLDKAREVLAPYKALNIDIARLDLMIPASIDAFVLDFLESGRALDLLINNAAVMACPVTRDARGFEAQFATNHLGHFQLTVGLWPALLRSGNARVVTVSSRGHQRGQIDFNDPHFVSRPYDRWQAYGQSKTANALFAMSVDKRGRDKGIRAFSLHPGGILATNLARHMSDAEITATGYVGDNGQPILDPSTGKKTIAQGAATTMWCALSQQLDGMGGVYCEDCDIAKTIDDKEDSILGVRPWARDIKLAERLWTLSEQLTGVGLD